MNDLPKPRHPIRRPEQGSQRTFWIFAVIVSIAVSLVVFSKAFENDGRVEIDQYLPNPTASEEDHPAEIPPTTTEIKPVDEPLAPAEQAPPPAAQPEPSAPPVETVPATEEPQAQAPAEYIPQEYTPPSEEPAISEPTPAEPPQASVYSDMPEALKGRLNEADWPYIAPAIDQAIASGERQEFVPWVNPTGAQGTAYQSGTGEDPEGCRQIRITIGGERIYLDKCQNGQYR